MQRFQLKHNWIPYIWVFPTATLLCVFKIFPILNSLLQSFLSLKEHQFTLNNYLLLFQDKTFWNAVWITLKFNLITIPSQIIIAFIMSLLVNKDSINIRIFRTILYLPFCISLTIATVLWMTLLNINNGVVNSFLSLFKIRPIGFLIEKKWALLSIILIASWRGCAYWMMFFLAGLKTIDTNIYEAARIDGCTFWSILFRITIPLLKNVFLFIVVANTTANFLLFAPVQIATAGGPQGSTNVLMHEAYRSAFRYSNQSRSACIVTLLLIIILLICIIQNRWLTEKESEK